MTSSLPSLRKKSSAIPVFVALLLIIAASTLFLFASGRNPPLEKTNASLSPSEFRNLELPAQLKALDLIANEQELKEAQTMIRAAYPDEQSADHELGHRIGEIAFRQFGFDGLKYCDASLAFGCFHGVAFAAVKKFGLRDDIGQKFWDGCQSQTIPGNCLHGLGHAIAVIKNYDLLPAFKECEQILASDNDRFWCYDGIVMEDITRTLAGRQNPYAKLTDPRAPCDTLPNKYETVCVRNHIAFVKERLSLSYDDTLELCQSYTSRATVRECVHMMGNAVAGIRQKPSDVIAFCRNAQTPYRQPCLEGGVIKLAMNGNFDLAQKICLAADPGESQRTCFSKIEYFRHERDQAGL